jgi:hypothetical protein
MDKGHARSSNHKSSTLRGVDATTWVFSSIIAPRDSFAFGIAARIEEAHRQ